MNTDNAVHQSKLEENKWSQKAGKCGELVAIGFVFVVCFLLLMLFFARSLNQSLNAVKEKSKIRFEIISILKWKSLLYYSHTTETMAIRCPLKASKTSLFHFFFLFVCFCRPNLMQWTLLQRGWLWETKRNSRGTWEQPPVQWDGLTKTGPVHGETS